MLKTAFWQNAARQMPKPVRERYVVELARAERFEILLDGVIDAFAQAKLAIARAFARPTHQH